jgi:hypothetical protein
LLLADVETDVSHVIGLNLIGDVHCHFASLQFDLPFVETHRVTQLRFRPLNSVDDVAGAGREVVETSSEAKASSSGGGVGGGDRRQQSDQVAATSVWNCDGEIVSEPYIDFR